MKQVQLQLELFMLSVTIQAHALLQIVQKLVVITLLTDRKGQTWSTDAIVAVAIFIVVLMSFLFITGRSNNDKNLDLYADEASKIPELFARSQNDTLKFIDGNKVNIVKLNDLSLSDYDQLKFMLGINHDFCIHFEDDKGNVIFINQTYNITGIGSSRAKISNYSCS